MKTPALDLSAWEGVPFPVASRDELRREGVVRAEGMGHAFAVVWNGGDPRVYAGSCPHLGLPMSMGEVEGDVMRCRYHGWGFRTDDGDVCDQPTLRKPRKCQLERFGALMIGGLVFSWIGDPAAIHIRLQEASRDLSMYATCADFTDEGGVNRFQTFVTPLGASDTLYWECYSARSRNPIVRAAATLLFKTVVVRLLDTEDRDWTSVSAPNFLSGDNIHLRETDLPLVAHLRKFVLPRATRVSG